VKTLGKNWCSGTLHVIIDATSALMPPHSASERITHSHHRGGQNRLKFQQGNA
jgi:hypothetical protein